MMWARRVLVIATAVVSLAGCAARSRAVRPETRPGQGEAALISPFEDPTALEQYIARVRAVSRQAIVRPVRSGPVTVERWDRDIAAVLLAATVDPGPDREKAVAREYLRLNVPDQAAKHLGRALLMNPKDAGAHEGLARIWRDGGLLGMALADAHRAVYYAPRSASAQNTLGTILLRLGRTADAIDRFDRAVELDGRASYALNNACYAWLLAGEFARAAAACERALGITPDLAAARNNQALAYAASGDFDAAARALGAGGDVAVAAFNMGLINLAGRRFGEAAAAFEEAARLRPGFTLAEERAAEARRLAAHAFEEGPADERR